MGTDTVAPVHDLLLGLAGRLDDDLLGWVRELLAVGEQGQAVELATAALAAERVVLPPPLRAALVDAAGGARTDLDVDAALPPAAVDDGTPHRFDAGAARGEVVEAALAALPARRLAGCTVRLTWRCTPAGTAPGPVPHAVVLVEAEPDRSPDVLAYLLATELDRAGTTAAVEVFTAGTTLPAYHVAALRGAREVLRRDAAAPPPPPVGRHGSGDTGAISLFAEPAARPGGSGPDPAVASPATGRRRRPDTASAGSGPGSAPAGPGSAPDGPAARAAGPGSVSEPGSARPEPGSVPPESGSVWPEPEQPPNTDPFSGPLNAPLLAPLLEPTGLEVPGRSEPSRRTGTEGSIPAEPAPDAGRRDPSHRDPSPRDPSHLGSSHRDPGSRDQGSRDQGPVGRNRPDPGRPAQPDSAQPGRAQSGTAQPGTAQPGTAQPGTAQPDTTQARPAQARPMQAGPPGQGGPARPSPSTDPAGPAPAELPEEWEHDWQSGEWAIPRPQRRGSEPDHSGGTRSEPDRPRPTRPPTDGRTGAFEAANGRAAAADAVRLPRRPERPAGPDTPARRDKVLPGPAPFADRPMDSPTTATGGRSLFESPTGRVESAPQPRRGAPPVPPVPEAGRPTPPSDGSWPESPPAVAPAGETRPVSFHDDPLFGPVPDAMLFGGPPAPADRPEEPGPDLPRRERRAEPGQPPLVFPAARTPAPEPPYPADTGPPVPEPAGPSRPGPEPAAMLSGTEGDLLAQLQAELAARDRRPRPYRRAGTGGRPVNGHDGRAVNGHPGGSDGPPDLTG